jgi:hypothetical protein
MRVVSLVPSWTETLIASEVQIVGRTRYCIHPEPEVLKIPVVGGTKEVKWDLIAELRPDIVIMDKEENPLELAEECPYPYLATHVTSLVSLHQELERLGDFFKNSKLIEMAILAYDIVQAPRRQWSHREIPGLVDWVGQQDMTPSHVVYIIWKKPWMSVSQNTFIGSVLDKLGAHQVHFAGNEKYPCIEIEEFKESFFLFSTEPFPFLQKKEELKALGLRGAVVDGEVFSWFGKRSLDFLAKVLLSSIP